MPILEWAPPRRAELIDARGVMSSNVVKFSSVSPVSEVVSVLSSNDHHHNGFPVVDASSGKYLGLILRSHLLLILKFKRFFDPQGSTPPEIITPNEIRSSYPRFFPIDHCRVTETEMNLLVDLSPYLNQSANILTECATLGSIFRLFRSLGLRHVVVVDSDMRPIGIVTRKDISRFRDHKNHVERLPIDRFEHSSVHYD